MPPNRNGETRENFFFLFINFLVTRNKRDLLTLGRAAVWGDKEGKSSKLPPPETASRTARPRNTPLSFFHSLPPKIIGTKTESFHLPLSS